MTMRYARLTEEDISGLNGLGVHALLAEVLPDGGISREVGLNQLGAVIHRFPGTGKFGRHGILDNARLNLLDQTNDVSRSYFEEVYGTD